MSETDLDKKKGPHLKYKTKEEAKQAKAAYMVEYMKSYYQKNKDKFYTLSDGSKKIGRPRKPENECLNNPNEFGLVICEHCGKLYSIDNYRHVKSFKCRLAKYEKANQLNYC